MQPFLQDVIVRFMRSVINVEPLGLPSVRRSISVTNTSVNQALTSTCSRASILAIGADIRFVVSSSSTTATLSSHLILQNERLDIHLPATPNIAAIRNGSVNGTLEISELLN